MRKKWKSNDQLIVDLWMAAQGHGATGSEIMLQKQVEAELALRERFDEIAERQIRIMMKSRQNQTANWRLKRTVKQLRTILSALRAPSP